MGRVSDQAVARAPVQSDRLTRMAVSATFLVHGGYFAAWIAHIPHVKASLGLSNSGLGVVLLGVPLGVVCALALSAAVLPRIGSRPGVRLSLTGYCLIGPLAGLAGSPEVLFAVLFAWGFFQACLDVAMNTQGIAVERAQDRQLMSGWHGLWSLGSLTGAALGAAAVGAGISLAAQQAALSIPILAGVGWLSVWMVDDPVAESAGAGPSRRRVRISPAILSLAAIAFAGLLCEGASADWGAVYLHTNLHTSAATAGLAYTVFLLSMMVVRLAGNRLLSGAHPNRKVSALAAIGAIGFALGLLSGKPVLTLIGFGFLGAGVAPVVPTMFSAAGRVTDGRVGSAVSTVAGLSYLGVVCGPPLIGAISGLSSLRAALFVLVLAAALIAIVTLRARALR